MPVSPLRLLALVLLLVFLLMLIQVNLLAIAFHKLGLSPEAGLLLILAALLGSSINLPVARFQNPHPGRALQPFPWMNRRTPVFTGWTVIAVNVGGCIIPLLFSLYLVFHSTLAVTDILLAVLLIAAASYLVSRPVAGLGVVMPVLAAPLLAAVSAILIRPDQSAPLAYIGGTLGVLIGADLLRLYQVRAMGAPVVSIGGAGTFDGIFLTGIVAALLA